MFKVNELVKASCGRLIHGRPSMVVAGISIDTRTIQPQEVFIAIKGQNFDGHAFIEAAVERGASCIILRKDSTAKNRKRFFEISKLKHKAAFIEVKDTVKALGDIAKFHRERFNLPVIAITGSNGKTTTKEMLTWVLAQRFSVLKNAGTQNNQIGLPMTLLKLNSKHEIVVLEAGTNHCGEIGYLAEICAPNIGVITNIGPSHLEHFKSVEGVFKEKSTLLKFLDSPRIAVINADDMLLRKMIVKRKDKIYPFSIGIKFQSDFLASNITRVEEGLSFVINNQYQFLLKTLGRYNIYNSLNAIAAARIMGMEYTEISNALKAFDFPSGRLNLAELNNVRFINDTYNSNPLSLKQALEALKEFDTKGRKIFVMGDMLELGDKQELFHQQAGQDAAQVCDTFIAVGTLSGVAAKAAAACGFDVNHIFTCNTPAEAREILFTKISPLKEDIVLVKGSRSMKMEEVFKQEQG